MVFIQATAIFTYVSSFPYIPSIFSSPQRLGSKPTSYPMATVIITRGVKPPVHEADHSLLVQWLRISGAIPPFNPGASMGWTQTTSPSDIFYTTNLLYINFINFHLRTCLFYSHFPLSLGRNVHLRSLTQIGRATDGHAYI